MEHLESDEQTFRITKRLEGKIGGGIKKTNIYILEQKT